MPKKYSGYFADFEVGDGQRSFLLSPSLEEVKKQIAASTEPAAETGDAEKGTPDDKNPALEQGLAREMRRAARPGLAHNHLIGVTTETRRNFPSAYVRQRIVEPAALEENAVEKVGDVTIFGVTEEDFYKLDAEIDSSEHVREGLDALPGAALMSLVATFDSLIADIVKKMLKLRPERDAASDKQIAVKDVLSMGSMDDFIDAVVEDDAYVFSRGSHEDQVKFIEKNLHVPIIAHWKHWPDFIEVFERRNLVAHGEEVYTARYVSNCGASGYQEAHQVAGQKVSLSPKYLRESSDILLEFSILLTFVLWRKHFSDSEEDAFSQLNQTTFELISHRRYTVARDILEFALSLKSAKMTEVVRRMMIVNLASAHRHLEDADRAKATLDEHDWSASSNEFKIRVAALKDDLNTVVDLVPTVVKEESISNVEFRRWPVFDFVRAEQRFQDAFEKAFGEPLTRSATSEEKPSDG